MLADACGLGVGIRLGQGGAGVVQRHLQDFGQVEGVTWRGLGDLLAATEAVGDDQPVGRRLADGGEEFEFADGNGEVVFVGLEAERARHAATAGGGALEVDAETVQD